MTVYIAQGLWDALGEAAEETGVSRSLGLAVMRVESDFRPAALGDDGQSVGLMQLHQRGAGAGYTVAELLDVRRNVAVGMAYLARMIAFTGGVLDGISAYNQGPGSWQTNGLPANPDYVKSVLLWWLYYAAEELTPMGGNGRLVSGDEGGPY